MDIQILERLILHFRTRQMLADRLGAHSYVTTLGCIPYSVTRLDVYVALKKLGHGDSIAALEFFYQELCKPVSRELYDVFFEEEQTEEPLLPMEEEEKLCFVDAPKEPTIDPPHPKDLMTY